MIFEIFNYYSLVSIFNTKLTPIIIIMSHCETIAYVYLYIYVDHIEFFYAILTTFHSLLDPWAEARILLYIFTKIKTNIR